MEVTGAKALALLSNSEGAVAVEDRKSGHRGKLDVRKGNNPDRG